LLNKLGIVVLSEAGKSGAVHKHKFICLNNKLSYKEYKFGELNYEREKRSKWLFL